MHGTRFSRAAALLSAGRLRHERIAHLPAECRPADEAQAYALQQEVHARLTEGGWGEVAGHKIGCTTPVMQRFLGIPNPCAGAVFSSTVYHGEALVQFDRYHHVGVECEIAVLLGRDLPPTGSAYTRAAVAEAVEACMAAIEIVDDRYTDYKSFDTPTLIADDFFDAGCVLGAAVKDWRKLDLTALTGVTRINGIEVGRGRGADVMGHPFEALAWLANALNARGSQLRRGEFVLTGSVVETKWVERNDKVVVSIDQLGEVRATFAG